MTSSIHARRQVLGLPDRYPFRRGMRFVSAPAAGFHERSFTLTSPNASSSPSPSSTRSRTRTPWSTCRSCSRGPRATRAGRRSRRRCGHAGGKHYRRPATRHTRDHARQCSPLPSSRNVPSGRDTQHGVRREGAGMAWSFGSTAAPQNAIPPRAPCGRSVAAWPNPREPGGFHRSSTLRLASTT